jgi:hypothetical protein
MRPAYRRALEWLRLRLGELYDPDADPRRGAMLHEIMDPAFVRARLAELRERGPGLLGDDDYDAMEAELDDHVRARAASADPQLGDEAYIPGSPRLSLLQSALTAGVMTRVEDLVQVLTADKPSFAEFELRAGEFFRQFGPCDPGWIESVVAKGIVQLEHKPEFVDGRAPDVPLADDARIVVVGDWGTGLPGARAVGRQMGKAIAEARKQRREVHALHLGDVYYSGWMEEYRTRFEPYWPVRSARSGVRSWALNGNHDMYSGGHGYFGYLLLDPRFAEQNQSSYFCLRGSHWQLLGLDTSYEDADLAGGQAPWVAARVNDSARKTMLLTHHQPFSGYTKIEPPVIIDKLKAAGVGHIDAWLWGHEHICCVYERNCNPFITFGACVGNGGVPVPPTTRHPPKGVEWQFTEAARRDSPWQPFGFAVLDLMGPRIAVRFWDENGPTAHTRTIE